MAMMQSLVSRLLSLPQKKRVEVLAQISDEDKALFAYAWQAWARPDQVAPTGDKWLTWLLLGGRGAGKTRTGAEFIRAEVKSGAGLIGMVAPTAADARDIMVEGPSGLLKVCGPRDVDYKGNFLGCPRYEPSKRRVTWFNGARATLFSAEEPDRLRGPQHNAVWADELAAWVYLRETWDMIQFGLRIPYPTGRQPKQCVTTTPRPLALIRELIKAKNTRVSRASTYDNEMFLASTFFDTMRDKYEGTRLGRQELRAEVLEDVQGALWTLDLINQHRVKEMPKSLQRVVVGVDPSGSSPNGDSQGIIVAGSREIYEKEKGAAALHGYVLKDYTMNGKPAEWGQAAVDAYYEYSADLIVAESNFGGEMVRHVIESIDDTVPVKLVTASRGKVVRAEPVSSLYEKGRVHHAGGFKDVMQGDGSVRREGALKELEDQMILMTNKGYTGEGSPDRCDAAVWALTELLVGIKRSKGSSGSSGRVNE